MALTELQRHILSVISGSRIRDGESYVAGGTALNLLLGQPRVRLEARDWIDVIGCHEKLQELGYLIWAACGKDPGLNPELILNEAARSGRYTRQEVAVLDFGGHPPEAGSLSRQWKVMLSQAAGIIATLPPEQVGTCILGASGGLFRGGPKELGRCIEHGGVFFHPGSVRGAFPSFPGDSREVSHPCG